jgi:hypothetical protein
MLFRSLGTILGFSTGLLLPLTALGQPTPDWETTVSVTSETNEGGDDMVVDAAGNTIVMGYLAVEQDFFVLKFDPLGGLLWSRTIAGSSMDNPGGLVVDDAGDVYIAGRTLSADFPTLLAYQDTLNGPSDAFVMKLDGDDGSVLFSTFFGGSRAEWAYGIALGDDGTITIAGSTDSINLETVDPIQSGLTLIDCFCDDAFVTQFSPQVDQVLFSTYLGGTYDDIANEVGVDAEGNIYFAGRTKSDDFPTHNAVQANRGGGEFDAFVARIAADRTLSYSTFLGGEDWELVQGMAIDDAGAAYVTGSTRSVLFPTTPGAFEETFVGGVSACEVPFGPDRNCYDMFVTKLNADGSYGYSTFIGGHHDDEPRNLVVDPAGRAYVIGYTYSVDFPLAAPFGTVVALRLNADGSDLDYLISHDTPGPNQGAAVAVLGDDLYITSTVGLPYDTYVAQFSDGGASGDLDGDGDVDLTDFAKFSQCFAGADNPPAPTCPRGANADLDGDGDVDLGDFAIFAQNFTGSL